jgi:hypothetical protein
MFGIRLLYVSFVLVLSTIPDSHVHVRGGQAVLQNSPETHLKQNGGFSGLLLKMRLERRLYPRTP